MKRTKVKEIKFPQPEVELLGETVLVKGWVKTVRKQKTFSFIEVGDGSSLSNLQVLLESSVPHYNEIIDSLTTGASIVVKGKIVENPKKKGALEVQAESIDLVGGCDAEKYPLQKKRHTFEFLRSIAHLRPRTNTLGSIARVRQALSFATHQFFQNRSFYWVNTPIVTASDCEGAGELFQVSTLDMEKLPKNGQGKVDYEKDFFEKPAYLTVSGQLNAEIFALALSDVYTFGPTFRAENSNTSRHLAEFWMIEPEMAFADLNDDMELADGLL